MAITLVAGTAGTAMAEEFSAFLRRPEIADYTGCRAYSRIEGRQRRDIYLINFSQLYANYGNNVDFRLRENAILLAAENLNSLYGPASVPPCRYRPGSRPELERIAAACRVTDSEKETALNIMRFCRDLHKKRTPDQENIYGGREEAMIERGEILCEELARLAVALAEIAGIPGRIVLHTVGGHYTVELHVDGEWAYFDPRMGVYFLCDDGRVASIRDLIADPGLIDRQSEAVKSEVVGYATWEERAARCRNIYFRPLELNCLSYYSLGDSEQYSFEELSEAEAGANGLWLYNRRYGELIDEITSAGR